MYDLQIHLISCHSIQFPLRSALIWSSLQASLWSKDTIPHLFSKFVTIYVCILGSFSSSKSKLIFSNGSSTFLSILLLSTLDTVLSICAVSLIMLWSLHFVGFNFFFKVITVTQMKSLGHSPVSRTLVCCWSVVWLVSVHPHVLIISCSLLIRYFFECFFRFTLQNIRALLVRF